MHTQIKFLQYQARFGRVIAEAQLFDAEGELIFKGPLASILSLCDQNKYEIVNAQEILENLVLINGFGA